MSSDGRPVSSGRDDLYVRVATALCVAACMGITLWLGPMLGIHGLWQGMLAIVVAIVVGAAIGRFVGRLLLRRSTGPSSADEVK